jgi:hypothetical protein
MNSSDDDTHIAEWYAPLGDTLSQGDIVDGVPHGLIEAPLTICQPSNTAPEGKAKYWPLDQLPKRRGVEFIHAKGAVGRGMVVWPDCQIDKPKNQDRPLTEWFAAIAAVYPMSRLDAAVRDKVVALNRAQFFPLPSHTAAGIQEPSYADLRFIWSVRYSLLATRAVALSDQALQALRFQLFWFFTEIRVAPSLECPHCQGAVDASALFQFKDEGEG